MNLPLQTDFVSCALMAHSLPILHPHPALPSSRRPTLFPRRRPPVVGETRHILARALLQQEALWWTRSAICRWRTRILITVFVRDRVPCDGIKTLMKHNTKPMSLTPDPMNYIDLCAACTSSYSPGGASTIITQNCIRSNSAPVLNCDRTAAAPSHESNFAF